ncbi:MAG: ATP-binding protein [Euryarchaeota archaeon]|nr:ATP-binding protein [Euryarchaeota archaeon]MBT7244878.1 ATP-binding protein [Euryarchaeota archaeon]
MSDDIPRVNIAVKDRILLHLLQEDEQADRYVVSASLTRPGIAEACAQHPPNVSRAMRDLLRNKQVSEHSRSIRGEDRKQKTWQLTNLGRDLAKNRLEALSTHKVLIRDEQGTLLEIESGGASERLQADMSVLQILLHAQHEGVLTFGDIRFGLVTKKSDENDLPPPGRLKLLAGAHATYHTSPPKTRPVHGRTTSRDELDTWFENDSPCMVIHGIAGIGKSTLVADWLSSRMEEVPHLSVCWYPCQPWDKQVGLAVSLLHRFGVDDKHDPYQLMETLPMTPGAEFDVDSWRRRLLAYLTDAKAIRERFAGEAGGPPPYWLIILDDVHHVADEARDLLGALLDISKKSPLRLLFISRTTLNVYDRRDVHTREVVEELPLKGLTVEEISTWVENMDGAPPTPEEVHKMTGGHPLALELLEIYGQATHGDWLKFLDEEIITQMPDAEHELLATLAVADSPVPWSKLSSATGWEGKPPERLLSYGLLLELEDGMWLHEALRERFLREVGKTSTKRKKSLK